MPTIPKCKTCGKPSIREECTGCKYKRIRDIYYKNPENREHRNKWHREYYKKHRETIIKQTAETRARRKEKERRG